MKTARRFFLLCVCTLCFSVARASGGDPVDMWILDLFNEPAQRPVKVNLWYPVGQCGALKQGQRCIAEDSRPDRVIVLSHGSMGSANEYNWLARALAARGYVVAGVSHFGESWVYGQETVEPAAVLRHWQRPRDISFMLDELAQRDLFQLPLDWNRAVVIGHSAGGQTAAALAGVRFDVRQLVEYCRSERASADRGCAYGKHAPLSNNEFIAAYAMDYSDKRVKAIVMLDPAIGPAATEESLRAMAVKALVIGAVNNDFLPYEHHAGRYAGLIKGAQTLKLTGNEGHFVFIDPCDHDHDALGVPLCRDKPGVNRAAVQATVATAVGKFVSEDLATSLAD